MARLPGSVLFACNYNAVRSPMAAAMLRRLHGRVIFVDSVGLRARAIDPFAVVALEEIGIDLKAHQSKTFEELEDTSFDLVISLTPEAQHRAVELTRTLACEVEFWPSLDPTATEGNRAEILAAYRAVRDGLWQRLRERFPAAPSALV
jgi:protein-tyrosine-phosphatase